MPAAAASSVFAIVGRVAGGRAIGPRDRLWHDLSLAGDDAWEVLEELHTAFGTDFSGLPFEDYFPAEHEALGESWMGALGFRRRRKPLTVQHLIEVVLHGAWFEPSRSA